MRVASYVLAADKEGLARVLVVLELDTSRLTFHREGERQAGAVDLTLVGMSRDLDNKVFPIDEGAAGSSLRRQGHRAAG